MVALTSTPVRPAVEAAEPPVRRRRTRPFRPVDAVIMLGYGLAAFLLYRPLWLNLDSGYLRFSGQDQNLWEWFYAVTAHNVLNFENLLFTTLQNHPDGVNLSANTAMYGLALPLTPVTILFGPTATFTLVLTGGLAGTASAWYWVLSRHLVDSRVGAAVGAAFCGFAPPMISHANAHPNWVALFVMPFIVLWLLKIVRGAPPVSSGIVLGLLVTWQVFIGKEPLLVMATTMVVFALVYALMAPGHTLAVAPRLGAGLGVGAAVSLVIVAVPLWWQFFGPQSYSALEHGLRGNDAAAFTAFASDSLAGGEYSGAGLAMNRTEENAFFGWPLVLVVLGITVALWRVLAARAVAVTMLAMAWISMGAIVIVGGEGTSIPGPWMLLFDRPLFESVLETRFSLGCVPLIGILLAMATERVLRLRVRSDQRRAAAVVWCGVLATALLPIVPTELHVTERKAAPAFFTEGDWRVYVRDGSVVPVPPPDVADAEALHWQMETGMGFPLVEGYFVGPNEEGDGMYGAPRRRTSLILEYVAMRGETYEVTAYDRVIARGDLRYWEADVVVLPLDAPYRHELQATVTDLLEDPGHPVKDVWVWDVHALLTR